MTPCCQSEPLTISSIAIVEVYAIWQAYCQAVVFGELDIFCATNTLQIDRGPLSQTLEPI